MRFFFDNCISPNLVAALGELEKHARAPTLVHLRSRFNEDTPDPVWITALGQEGDWIIISGDPRISRGRAERAAWHESGLTAFFLGDAWSNRRLHKQVGDFIALWPAIVQAAREAEPGSGFLIEAGSKKIKKIYTSSSPYDQSA